VSSLIALSVASTLEEQGAVAIGPAGTMFNRSLYGNDTGTHTRIPLGLWQWQAEHFFALRVDSFAMVPHRTSRLAKTARLLETNVTTRILGSSSSVSNYCKATYCKATYCLGEACCPFKAHAGRRRWRPILSERGLWQAWIVWRAPAGYLIIASSKQ
jgi:hypothetical protein